MKLARFSVQRPVFTTMATSIILILGGISLWRLPIDLMPDITYPTLSVSTGYEDANPEEVEELITRPIEEALSAVPGVEEITSTSSEGSSSVRISFSWGTDLDAAASDIRDKMDRVIPRLPDDADRPQLRKFDLASFPILILGVSSDLDPLQLRKLIDDQVKYRVERIAGVASLDAWGGLEREIHVNLDIDKIKALGLSLNQIMDRIRAGNVDFPAGTIEKGYLDIRVRTPGTYANLQELRDTVIMIREGVPVQLSDVASVEDSSVKTTRIIRVNGKPGLRLAVNKQSGTNTVEVAKAVLAEMQRINRDIPQIEITPIIDSSEYIEKSVNNISRAAVYGGGLAVLVLLLFLRNLRSTAIITVSIPVSIIATFMMIYFGGFTLNIMTLGGLALGVGMLMDNSIVVLENITRLRDSGYEKEAAAVEGSEEVTSAIIAGTLTTVAVFLPLIFVRGMAGVMFKQLSLVIGFSLLCSLAAAISLVPMLASKLIHPTTLGNSEHETWGHKIFRLSAKIFIEMEKTYKELLHFAIHHRAIIIISGVLLLAGSLALIPFIGSELMPVTDEGEVRINAEMEVGTRVDLLAEKFAEIDRIVRVETPEVLYTTKSLGGSNWRSSGGHSGDMRISLVPQKERTRTSEEIAEVLRKKLANLPGVKVRVRAGQGLFIMRMATSGGERIGIEIRGYDFDTADALAQQVAQVAQEVEGVTDTRISRESGSPERTVVIDRKKAADMKLTVSEIAEALRTVLAGTSAGNFREMGDEYRILVKVKDADKMRLEDILDLTITNSDNVPVVLRNVIAMKPRSGPVTIQRKDQERIVSVDVNISQRDMGSIIADIRERLQTVTVPAGFSIVFGGDYEEQQKAFYELLMSFILALVLVYMVMACQFESLRDPFVVMFSVPLAAIGVILMLLLTNTTFNVQTFIGCIMLGGIVVNNAILLVDHTNLLRRRDKLPINEAIEEAGRRRLRPILMTAFTTTLGLMPLALGVGEGGEAQAPMARAVIGGLLSSTFITLLFVPVVYSFFEKRMSHPQETGEL
ncbi:MAG: efflux RND transporter permease subunit [Planctomycetes bacterium]|nr:efflux RND transporter permease subunit [Planctomycetota bacterium]